MQVPRLARTGGLNLGLPANYPTQAKKRLEWGTGNLMTPGLTPVVGRVQCGAKAPLFHQ